MLMTECRHFTGYKPCSRSAACEESCPFYEPTGASVLVVHLEALGAVLRSTALLPAIRRTYPNARVTWVTQRPADALLRGNPLIDRVLTTDRDDLLALDALEFDAVLVIDKSLKASGVAKRARGAAVFGFVADPSTGAIMPATPAADELWRIGLNDRLKFHENRKTETQLACEALELGPWARDEYVLRLSETETVAARQLHDRIAPAGEYVIGINTGCSSAVPYKKLSIEGNRKLVERLAREPNTRVVLLGGPEDRVRNERIAFGLNVLSTPTDRGLRYGMVSVAACDAVVSGDSLGMHMAIALRKWTVAWFGPTCEQEIDLYGRGRKVISAATCGPCWKRSCARETMCYDLVSIDQLAEAALQGRATANGERDACQTALQTRMNRTAPDEPEIAI